MRGSIRERYEAYARASMGLFRASVIEHEGDLPEPDQKDTTELPDEQPEETDG